LLQKTHHFNFLACFLKRLLYIANMSCGNYAAITALEPQVHVFQDYNCTGNHRVMSVGLTPDLNVGPYPHRNAISGLVVPPHMEIEATTHYWHDFHNKGYGEKTKYGPGIHPNLNSTNYSWNAKGGNRYRGWNDDFDGINVRRKQSWPSWLDQCCKNQKGDSVCPTGYRHPNDTNCYNNMNAYCGGTNAFNSLCAQWKDAEKKKQEYCNSSTHFAEPRCKEWCMKKNADGSSNFGKCDVGARKFCGVDGVPNDPICSCINSKVDRYNPACVDANCATDGYLTATQSELACPNIVDCSIVMDLESQGVATLGEISQNCVADQGDGKPTVPVTAVEGTNMLMYLILVFLLVIIIGMAISMFYIVKNMKSSVI
jgi:hypothetical protein